MVHFVKNLSSRNPNNSISWLAKSIAGAGPCGNTAIQALRRPLLFPTQAFDQCDDQVCEDGQIDQKDRIVDESVKEASDQADESDRENKDIGH